MKVMLGSFSRSVTFNFNNMISLPNEIAAASVKLDYLFKIDKK
jgi:hypothetical protein